MNPWVMQIRHKQELNNMEKDSWKQRLVVCLVLSSFLLGLPRGAFSDSGTVTMFDAPGATYGTLAQSINEEGAIAGNYTESNFETHGFVLRER
jgi:hypothetical protein